MNIDEIYLNRTDFHQDDILLIKICLEYNLLSGEQLQKIVSQVSGRQLIYQIKQKGALSDTDLAKLMRLHNEKVLCTNCQSLVSKKENQHSQCKNCHNIITGNTGYTNSKENKKSKDKRYDKYKVLDKIGEGSVGVVYKAIQEDLDRIVALKIINKQVDNNVFLRFQQEAQSIASLDHPSVVSLYDIGQKGNEYFLAMEYVDGKTLTKYIKKKKLSLEDVLKITVLIIRGIEHAHNKKIIHRDIKPDNIIITPNKIPKITDFGLARRLNQESRITRNDIIMGTPVYMSPEQARGDHNIEYSTDIYSTGVVFYEMLCGKLPFTNSSTTLYLLNQIAHDTPDTPQNINPEIPSDLNQICLKALEKDPNKRYKKIKDFGDDIEQYLEENYLKKNKITVVDDISLEEKTPPPAKPTLRIAIKESLLEWYDIFLLCLLTIAIIYFIYKKIY